MLQLFLVMFESPVLSWMPIFAKEPSAVKDADREARQEKIAVDRFVEKLMSSGACELNIKGPNGEKIIITCRRAGNPYHKKETISKQEFLQSRGFSNAFTSILSLDLIMQASPTSADYHPVGYRDYKVAKFPDHCVANGNFACNRKFFPKFKEKRYQAALGEADENMPLAPSGIKLSEELRDKKIGKFMMVLSFEILKRMGVTEIDMTGSISDKLSHIVKKFGYSANNTTLQLDNILQYSHRKAIIPFI